MTQENKHKQKKDIKRTSPVETEINLKIYKRRVGSVNQTEMLCYNYKGFKSKSKFIYGVIGGRKMSSMSRPEQAETCCLHKLLRLCK